MSETANNEGGTSAESEKPVQDVDVIFPPFPDPTEEEFEEDISDTERNHYRTKFSDLNIVKTMRLHCSACDRHLGSSTRNESRMRAHPMLRTLVCHTCHTFYNSGEFEKGDDGSELYCRWCGQGGQVYCCSDCPHVFCAKCIKRNLGAAKIKEIENTDDWKCFKCNPKCLWDLRALCWALLRYCDMKNKITYKTEDSELKEKYQKDCATDHSECCKYKTSRRKEKSESIKKKEDIRKENETKKAISKIPSTIQVKKFASINLDEPSKDKKGQKRPPSQENKGLLIIKNPITIAPCQKNFSPSLCGPPAKKPRMPLVNPIRFAQDRKAVTTYTRIRPKAPIMPIPIPPLVPSNFNGFNNINNSFLNNSFNNSYNNINNMMASDNINLSLESLTQGLDMVAVANMNTAGPDDDVVCTPDFPLEPLCEVTEDNTDDDVQCITPGPVAAPKVATPQPPVPRLENSLPDLSPENIIQMTDNDVTVNAVTGGLKFRVDPQTLSSNKMYRLPDGRIFAIKANPNMPGGYSATIVAVTETGQGKIAPKGATYAAKLSAVTSSQTSTPSKPNRSSQNMRQSNTKRSTPRSAKVNRGTDTSSRECDLHVPVEWYRYNLIDAIDAVEYSLSRLNKLRNEATSVFLRTRTVDEMRNLHRTLERLLNTSSTRFTEIKENLNKELKQYVLKKTGSNSEDDDDVEILMPELDNDDPIFIDENSMESTINEVNCNESQEVDLTGVGSSDHNDSAENNVSMDNVSNVENVSEVPSADDTGSPSNESNKINLNDADNLNEGENAEIEGSRDNQDSKITCEKNKGENNESEHNKDIKATNDKRTAVQTAEDDVKNKKTEGELDTEERKKNSVEAQINGNTGQTKDNDKCDGEKDKCDEENDRCNEEKDRCDEEKDKCDKEKDKCDKEIDKSVEKKDESDENKDDSFIKKDKRDEEKDKSNNIVKEELLKDEDSKMLSDSNANNESEERVEDSEMSEEMIETLLKDDNIDDVDSMLNNKAMEVTESL